MSKKRGFNPIRFIFKLIMWIFILIIGTIIFVVVMLYKDAKPPVVEDGTIFDVQHLVSHSLDDFFQSSDRKLFLGADTDELNYLIEQTLKDPDAPSDKLIEDEYYDLIGAWITTKDDEVHMHASAHAKMFGITYKTQLHLGFKLMEVKSEDNTSIELTLVKLNIGKLPLAWVSGVADFIVKQFFKDFDIEQLVESQLGVGAKFNLKERKLTIDIEQMVADTLSDDVQMKNIALLFLDVLYKDSDLISLDINDTSLGINANFKVLENLSPIKVVEESKQIKTEIEFEAFMAYKSTSLFVSLLAEDKKISFNELEFNQLVWYLLSSEQTEDTLFTNEIMEDYMVSIYMPYASLGTNMEIEIPLKIYQESEPTNYFQTKLIVNSSTSMAGDDLIIKFDNLNLGEINLDSIQINTVLEVLQDNEMFSSEGLVIKDFKQQLSFPNLSVENVSITTNNFNVHIKLDDNTNLVIDEVIDALDTLKTDPNLGTEITNILDALDNDLDVDEAVSDFIDALSELDEAEQQEFLDGLLDLIDPDLIGQFMQ